MLDQSIPPGCGLSENIQVGSRQYQPQRKDCGHNCWPSTVPKCCWCSDLRPILDGDVYPCYVDGEGWMNNEARDAGYCPVCNPRNYEIWEKKIEMERIKKAEQRQEQERKLKEDERVKEEDRSRAASQQVSMRFIDFVYSNGDMYSGEMECGVPHGHGVMNYATGEVYSGHWLDGRHHGKGNKNWGDGIAYTGHWKDNMMHGEGHYVMADGTEVIGVFFEDEFVE